MTTRLYGGRLAGGKTAFLENYKAEVEAAFRAEGYDARELERLYKTIECVPVLVGSLFEIVLAERARSRARDRHSAKRKNAK